MMLYMNLKQDLPIFQRCYKKTIAATFDCERRCIPGFLYISSATPLSKLNEYMAKHANEFEKNDMLLIKDFSDIYSKKYIDHLLLFLQLMH